MNHLPVQSSDGQATPRNELGFRAQKRQYKEDAQGFEHAPPAHVCG